MSGLARLRAWAVANGRTVTLSVEDGGWKMTVEIDSPIAFTAKSLPWEDPEDCAVQVIAQLEAIGESIPDM